MQADGLRYALESDRRRKYHNSGTLPWQFNEPYPMAACTSAVDYYAQPKPVYYAVARAYAPLLVSARFPTQAWKGFEQFEAEAWVCNSREHSYSNVTLRVRLIGTRGQVYAERTETISFGANCATGLTTLDEPLDRIPEDVFFLDLQLLDLNGAWLAHNRYAFSRSDDLAPLLACPPTKLSVASGVAGNEQSLTLTNAGDTAAMFVWLEDAREVNVPGYVYFDDNYFCLLRDESRTVLVTWADVPVEGRRLEISSWNTERTILPPSLNGGS
jgi:beta-mannosidase